MALHRQPQPHGGDKLSRSTGNTFSEFTASIPYRHAIQMKHLQNLPGDAESDSKSVQVPSLSADDSSRASSINNLDFRSEADDSGGWLLHENGLDGHNSVLRRSGSPTSMEELNLNRTPTDLSTPPDRPNCNTRHMSLVVSESQSKPTNNIQTSSIGTGCQALTFSAESMSTTPTAGESKELGRQENSGSDVSDSESESEEDSDDEEIPDGEWSGANDNIEATLYQAVYPDLKLAVHLISTMYPTIVRSYNKKISRKVYSWQEKNIATCGTGSGTASTSTETSPQGTSNAANKSSPKRDRQSDSPDDDIGDDEDDDLDESRRKRRKEKDDDNEPEIPEQKLACPFFKNDPVKYSAAQSGHKSCTGPGYVTVASLKEHLKRVHRPVQCPRCYQIFPHKGVLRSSAIAEFDKHFQQDEPCHKNPDSLREGINDVDWSRLNEKKQSRKGKGKRKVTIPEKPQSTVEQWFEIWAILFPSIEPPPTPWYEAPFFASIASSRSQGQQHFLYVFEKVVQQKLPEFRAAAVAGTDEELIGILLNLGQKTYSTCAATYRVAADASTSSFYNIDGSSGESGSWQPVENELYDPRKSLSRVVPALPDLDSTTQIDHSVPAGTLHPKQAMMDGREINMNQSPPPLSTAAYVGTSQNIPDGYNYEVPLTSDYPAAGRNVYHNPPSGRTTYPDVPSRPNAYQDGPNPTDTEMPGTMWPPNMFSHASQADFDMDAQFPTVIPHITNSSNLPDRWGDHDFNPNYRGFGGAP